MPRKTHIETAIELARPSLLDYEGRARLAKTLQPAVDRAVKSCLRSIQRAQKSPQETRRWALDGLPYTAHFDDIVSREGESVGIQMESAAGLALCNAVYRTLVNTRKKGTLFKLAASAVRKKKKVVKKKAKRA